MSRDMFHELDDDEFVFYEKHAEGIRRAVYDKFRPFPKDFQLKPITFCRVYGYAKGYAFMMNLPNGQYARVVFGNRDVDLLDLVDIKKLPKQTYYVNPASYQSAYD